MVCCIDLCCINCGGGLFGMDGVGVGFGYLGVGRVGWFVFFLVVDLVE